MRNVAIFPGLLVQMISFILDNEMEKHTTIKPIMRCVEKFDYLVETGDDDNSPDISPAMDQATTRLAELFLEQLYEMQKSSKGKKKQFKTGIQSN